MCMYVCDMSINSNCASSVLNVTESVEYLKPKPQFNGVHMIKVKLKGDDNRFQP